MSLTATLTLLLPLLRTAVRAGCSGWGVIGICHPGQARAQAASAGAPRRDAHLLHRAATAATASFISVGPIAPMQPTRNVSTCVSLPG